MRLIKMISIAVLTLGLAICLCACGSSEDDQSKGNTSQKSKEQIEEALDLSKMDGQWTYDGDSDAWTLAPVTAVTDPQIEDEQGVSVCVPGAYVKGIDTDGDGKADVTADNAASGTEQSASETEGSAVTGDLIIDRSGKITSTNGQKYTATTAPVIVNTGAAGYSEQQNQTAQSTYAKEGYINVACGNRGKQSTLSSGSDDSDSDSSADSATKYTGDAPCCLVDQKNAVRFVKYNILLGNLPGSVDYFVSTGGSGGGAHAAMLAATSDNPDYYAYEAEAGAVGVYKDGDEYTTSVTIDGQEVELSDGMWGCMAYSAITSLQEADMALAFEYYLDSDYGFSTDFQKELAKGLSKEYMEYINGSDLKVDEAKAGLDIDGDGKQKSTVKLTIEYDREKYADTNGYGGSYLDYYLAEFEQSLQDYLDRLAYTEDWTWFDSDGNVLSDSDVAAMTDEDKAKAFIEGRYTEGTTSDAGQGMPDGGPPAGGKGKRPDGNGGPQGGGMPPNMDGNSGDSKSGANNSLDQKGTQQVGTPDAGTTQASGSATDSSNYSSFEEMLDAYREDIASIEEGDEYGNNIVSLYDPTEYIGKEGTNDPTWTRILMGASEGDISMMNSLNLQAAWLEAGTDAQIEWQWDGGHVPSEILGDSLPLYVDMMYGKYVEGAVEVKKPAAEKQTENGDSDSAEGTDISGWVSYDSEDGVGLSLSDVVSYRTEGAAKAMPAFDVIDYGQEDYVFGNSTTDARHWDKYVLKVLEENADELKELFNAAS